MIYKYILIFKWLKNTRFWWKNSPNVSLFFSRLLSQCIIFAWLTFIGKIFLELFYFLNLFVFFVCLFLINNYNSKILNWEKWPIIYVLRLLEDLYYSPVKNNHYYAMCMRAVWNHNEQGKTRVHPKVSVTSCIMTESSECILPYSWPQKWRGWRAMSILIVCSGNREWKPDVLCFSWPIVWELPVVKVVIRCDHGFYDASSWKRT